MGVALQPAVARMVATYHSSWLPKHGICPNCAQQYAAQVAGKRHSHSLHTTHTPHTTYPYYHPWEEGIYSQPERLPDYSTFSGHDVTIAFLDSGYYPHPDLLTTTWNGPTLQWERLTAQNLQQLIQNHAMRLLNYVDLSNGGERVGLTQSSLWDGAGDSWHGQMTTTIAAGSGLLSDGRYRGYAPQASLLPIKIGRGGGRIPEADILRGLEWLLRDDNWARYNVRVLNISVGGDFNQPWQQNPVAQAAESLFARGVFIAAAAGNNGGEELRAPASAPSVLTVGGVDDGNRPWPVRQESVTQGLVTPGAINHSGQQMSLYSHNYGVVALDNVHRSTKNGAPNSAPNSVPNSAPLVKQQRRLLQKPELLALARWLPAPILPASPIFREVATIGEMRRLLLGYDPLRNDDFRWRDESMHHPDTARFRPPAWMPEVWHGLRQRMNAHKWIHPYYQHVDGTSVSVAQVSAVAAQMVEANPNLTATQIRSLLLECALPLPNLPHHLTGHGLLQPRKAVALALRTAGGILTGRPLSGTLLALSEIAALQLPTWQILGDTQRSVSTQQDPTVVKTIYLGCYAPEAEAVSIIGDFNEWQPNRYPMERTAAGWWHGALALPKGRYAYRFWLDFPQQKAAQWQPDMENTATVESGYSEAHSLLLVG